MATEGTISEKSQGESERSKTSSIAGGAPVALIVLIIAWILATPLAYRATARSVYTGDPFIYGVAAKQVLAGQRLYSQVHFDKGPLVVLFYAIPELLFPQSYLAMGAFCGVCISLTAILFWWTFRKSPVTSLAGVLFLTICPLTVENFQWLSTEQITNPLVMGNLLLGYLLLRDGQISRRRCLLAGILTCLAFNIRQTTLLFAAVPAAAILLCNGPLNRKLMGLGWAVIGGVATLLPILALVAGIADFHGYLHAMTGGAKQYAGIGSWFDSLILLVNLFVGPWCAPFALFLCVALCGRYRWLALTATLTGMAVIALPRREYTHYIVNFLPVIALLIGMGLETSNPRGRALGWISVPFILLVLFPSAGLEVVQASLKGSTSQMQAMAAQFDALASPPGTLMVVGRLSEETEALMYMSRLAPANDFWIDWELDPPVSALLPRSIDEIKAEYLAHPPTIVAIDNYYLRPGPNGSVLYYEAPGMPHETVLQIAVGLLKSNAYQLKVYGPDQRYWIWVRRIEQSHE